MVYLPKSEMETLRSAFNAQLASVMDSLLAAAVCEIAKIFESSLCQHQAELLQKTNEISILRSELEKVERSTESVIKSADVNEKTTAESGPKVKQEPDPVNISDDVGLCENSQNTVIKEEGKFLDEAPESQHQNDSKSNLELATIHASEMQLSLNQQEPFTSAQAKDEAPHCDQSNLSASQLHEDAPSPPLSVSSKVCCNTGQMEGWLPALNLTQESTIENLQSKKTAWSDALNRRTDFGVAETLPEENNGAFVNQGSENPTTSHDIHSTARREGGLKNHLRQGSTFRSKERPQSNHTFTLRNMDCLGLAHHPAGSGLTGRPYTCPYCAKCFAYPSHQRRHLLRHTGVRLHSCQFCDKSFLTPSELTVHIRTHTGERPFSCGQCGKRFARSGNLRAHQRDVHLGKRPFACTDCGKRFAHKGNLRVHHHRVHQGQRYYSSSSSLP